MEEAKSHRFYSSSGVFRVFQRILGPPGESQSGQSFLPVTQVELKCTPNQNHDLKR